MNDQQLVLSQPVRVSLVARVDQGLCMSLGMLCAFLPGIAGFGVYGELGRSIAELVKMGWSIYFIEWR